MNIYLALKIGFFAAMLFFVAAAGAVSWQAWRADNGSIALGRSMQRPWLLAWWIMALSLASLPVTGWWLAHLGAWPLGQLWMLLAELAYLLAWGFWLLTLHRVRRLPRIKPAPDEAPQPTGQHQRTYLYGGLSMLCFALIVALLAFKPA